jgi:hypothetical protein
MKNFKVGDPIWSQKQYIGKVISIEPLAGAKNPYNEYARLDNFSLLLYDDGHLVGDPNSFIYYVLSDLKD